MSGTTTDMEKQKEWHEGEKSNWTMLEVVDHAVDVEVSFML